MCNQLREKSSKKKKLFSQRFYFPLPSCNSLNYRQRFIVIGSERVLFAVTHTWKRGAVQREKNTKHKSIRLFHVCTRLVEPNRDLTRARNAYVFEYLHVSSCAILHVPQVRTLQTLTESWSRAENGKKLARQRFDLWT